VEDETASIEKQPTMKKIEPTNRVKDELMVPYTKAVFERFFEIKLANKRRKENTYTTMFDYDPELGQFDEIVNQSSAEFIYSVSFLPDNKIKLVLVSGGQVL
jgi:hypothetical protein